VLQKTAGVKMAANINSSIHPSIHTNDAFNISDTGFLTELRFYAEIRQPAGWPETDAILPPAVFDNTDRYGEIGQSGICIIKYSFVYDHSSADCSDYTSL